MLLIIRKCVIYKGFITVSTVEGFGVNGRCWYCSCHYKHERLDWTRTAQPPADDKRSTFSPAEKFLGQKHSHNTFHFDRCRSQADKWHTSKTALAHYMWTIDAGTWNTSSKSTFRSQSQSAQLLATAQQQLIKTKAKRSQHVYANEHCHSNNRVMTKLCCNPYYAVPYWAFAFYLRDTTSKRGTCYGNVAGWMAGWVSVCHTPVLCLNG